MYTLDSYTEFTHWIKYWAWWTCSDCWWRAERKDEKYEIVLHYKDLNRSNYTANNLVVICRDCRDIRYHKELSVKRLKIVKERYKKVLRKVQLQRDESGWPVKVGSTL